MLDKIKKLVTAAAPRLGSMLTGPFAGAVLAELGDKLAEGRAQEAKQRVPETLEIIWDKLQDPQNLVNLREIEQSFLNKLDNFGIDTNLLGNPDTPKSRFYNSLYPQAAISAIFIVGYFWNIHYFIKYLKDFSEASPGAFAVIATLTGVLSTAIPHILSFWLGSSPGSKLKDEVLGDIARRANNV